MNTVNQLPRYTLFAVIAAILFMLLTEWSQFSKKYDEKQINKLSTIENIAQPINIEDESLPTIDPAITTVQSNNQQRLQQDEVGTPSIDSNTNVIAQASRQIIVESDTLRIAINKLGGDITEVAMLKHLTSLSDNAEPLRLLEKNSVRTYVAQSGLIGDKGSNVKSARAVFSSNQDFYKMEGDEPLSINLFFNDANGVRLTKTFVIEPNSYLIKVSYNIENGSNQLWEGTFYSQISRDNSEDPGTGGGFGMQSYLGTATTTEDSPYKKISFKDIEKAPFRNTYSGGWIAMIQHYFVSAWVPVSDQEQHYFTKKTQSGLNIIGFYSNPFEIQPGQSGTVSANFYAGPKNQYKLAELATHLDLTVDYGWLWWIAQPLYALLYMFATGDLHAFDKVFHIFPGFNNWGIAIIMLTVVVKALFFKLSAASYRSMANMRRVQPKLLSVRERYANDKQAQSKAMMELYQKEKINPLGGCLPILIQMPVFIALYWALMESVELRHSSFLWLKDLSVEDPYFILPLLMGITMWFQQKMNPAPPDPMQAKIMQWMPVVFTFFFLWFPAGLVVYWVSNNLLSIAQQWVITRKIEKEASA